MVIIIILQCLFIFCGYVQFIFYRDDWVGKKINRLWKMFISESWVLGFFLNNLVTKF